MKLFHINMHTLLFIFVPLYSINYITIPFKIFLCSVFKSTEKKGFETCVYSICSETHVNLALL